VLKVSADPSDVESVTLRYLMYVLVPAWFVPGVADRGGWLSPPRLRRRRLPAAYLAAVFGGMAGLIGLPYAEEAWRCARALRTLGPGDADV